MGEGGRGAPIGHPGGLQVGDEGIVIGLALVNRAVDLLQAATSSRREGRWP